ncbi:MAG: hypothetical protein AB8G11_00290 [Saprospiraceae bacterium]
MKALKARLNQDFEHPYKAEIFVKNIKQAIKTAQENDGDVNSDFPEMMETKVYQLAQSIMNSILKP